MEKRKKKRPKCRRAFIVFLSVFPKGRPSIDCGWGQGSQKVQADGESAESEETVGCEESRCRNGDERLGATGHVVPIDRIRKTPSHGRRRRRRHRSTEIEYLFNYFKVWLVEGMDGVRGMYETELFYFYFWILNFSYT